MSQLHFRFASVRRSAALLCARCENLVDVDAHYKSVSNKQSRLSRLFVVLCVCVRYPSVTECDIVL